MKTKTYTDGYLVVQTELRPFLQRGWINANAALLHGQITSWMNDDPDSSDESKIGMSWAGMERLASGLGIHRATVHRCIEDLERAGLLYVWEVNTDGSPASTDGLRGTNRYGAVPHWGYWKPTWGPNPFFGDDTGKGMPRGCPHPLALAVQGDRAAGRVLFTGQPLTRRLLADLDAVAKSAGGVEGPAVAKSAGLAVAKSAGLAVAKSAGLGRSKKRDNIDLSIDLALIDKPLPENGSQSPQTLDDSSLNDWGEGTNPPISSQQIQGLLAEHQPTSATSVASMTNRDAAKHIAEAISQLATQTGNPIPGKHAAAMKAQISQWLFSNPNHSAATVHGLAVSLVNGHANDSAGNPANMSDVPGWIKPDGDFPGWSGVIGSTAIKASGNRLRQSPASKFLENIPGLLMRVETQQRRQQQPTTAGGIDADTAGAIAAAFIQKRDEQALRDNPQLRNQLTIEATS